MKNLFKSFALIFAAGALVVGATMSFFSDEETSTGNTFTAGEIDLLLTNEHSTSANGLIDNVIDWTTFEDVNDRLFFNFSDLKPGDWGENTIGLKVMDNDAWLCASIVGVDDENGLVEPETDLGDDATEGELGKYLTFAWWADDGDNVLEDEENVLFGGPVTFDAMMGDDDDLFLTLADSYPLNIFTGNTSTPEPIVGEDENHIGVAWCYGTMDLNTNETGWGFSCDGAGNQNDSQTDMITATLAFEAFQSRNSDDFECPDTYRDTEPAQP